MYVVDSWTDVKLPAAGWLVVLHIDWQWSMVNRQKAKNLNGIHSSVTIHNPVGLMVCD